MLPFLVTRGDQPSARLPQIIPEFASTQKKAARRVRPSRYFFDHQTEPGSLNVATRCDFCGKKPAHGFNVSHSQRHTKRRWLPNVHRTTLTVNGQPVRVDICTRCLRTYHKTTAVAKT